MRIYGSNHYFLSYWQKEHGVKQYNLVQLLHAANSTCMLGFIRFFQQLLSTVFALQNGIHEPERVNRGFG